jgi:uncharacterized protein (TIGR03437 family)
MVSINLSLRLSFCLVVIVSLNLICLMACPARMSLSFVRGQGNSVAIVSAASFANTVAPDSIASIFGSGLATSTAIADRQPLPTELAGTTVTIGGVATPLFSVAPNQVNCLIPATLLPGRYPIVVRAGNGTLSQGEAQINSIAPGIFTADASGRGRPAAQLIRVRNGNLIYENIGTAPIDFGPESEPAYLSLYLTGLRHVTNNVRVFMGNNVVSTDAARSPQFAGLDQINALIPRNLIGRGRVNVSIAVPGLGLSNEVQIDIAGSSGIAAPQGIGFDSAEASAGEQMTITGSNFNPDRAKNIVRIGGVEATVLEASSGQLRVTVPFGAESGPVSVITENREGRSAGNLTIKTSLSGFVEDTRRQPLRDVTVRLRGANGVTIPAIKTTAEGLFSFKNLPNLGSLVQIEIDPISAPQLGSLPFPVLVIKKRFGINRDNYVERIPLQQESGPSVQVGSTGNVAAAPEQGGFARQIATGGVVFDVQTDTPIFFADGSTSGRITMTIVADSRTPVSLPPSEYSSSVVQLTPFNAKLMRGGKLTFPNPERFPAGTQATLYRLDTPPDMPTSFTAVGKAVVSADIQRIETDAGKIDTTSYYFVSLPRRSTTVVGRVVDSDKQTPIRGALVSSRGQTTLTDGDGSFLLRSVLVNEGDEIAVDAGYLRPNGRVDRGASPIIRAVIDGITTLPAPIALTSQESNRLPIVLAPDSLIISEGEQRDVLLIAAHPDNGQIIKVEVSGAVFATLSNNGTGLYTLRLSPGQNSRGTYTLRLIATDNLGQTATYEIKLTVNGRPVAMPQTLITTQNQPLNITLTGEDPEGFSLSYIIVARPVNGQLEGAPPNLTYTPNIDFVGSDQLIFKVNDVLVDSAEARVTIAVTPPANRPPTLTVPDPKTVAVGAPLNFTVTASDPDANQTLTITATNRPGGSNFTQTNNTSARFSWTPNASQTGNHTVNFEVADNGNPSLKDTKSVTITVNAPSSPQPTITSFSPNSATAGGAAFTLTVNGTNFINGSVVRWNGGDRATTFVSSTQLAAQISASDIVATGTANVTVFNPAPGGGLSNPLTFTVSANELRWMQTSGPPGGDIRAFAVSGTTLFAGTSGGGVYRSSDNGQNWMPVNNGLTNTIVEALAVSGTTLFAGTANQSDDGGIFRSTDNGQSWIQVYNGLPFSDVKAFAVRGTNLFAGTVHVVPPEIYGSVLRSSNNGMSWGNFNNGLNDKPVNALALSGTTLFAGTSGGGVYRSSDNGQNWMPVNNGLTNTIVEALAVSGMTLFAGTNGRGVYRSIDNGQSWTAVNNGLTDPYVYAFAVSGTTLFAGTFGGVYRSSDNGQNWTAVNNGLTNPVVLALAVSGTNLFAGTRGGGVFVANLAGTP